ncbi:little elongation complex subunit 1 isoform X2 [Narcine bancroftii]|uniref:little elongation complex subunit 1 isoform X2 n=1 Tax=Narcine bancroftii TaxID=1343680 RepID=UPI0038310DE7
MMPGESRSQNLNEYVTAFISLKQKIIDTDHVLTEYQKKCDELQKTERDRQTLRDQLDESLQKFVSLEKCKEEMDAMRVELEEKRSSIKMYQQTHLEFSKLEQDRIKNDALTKKLEIRIKKLEETTTKQIGEIKQLKKEKKMLERNLKKTQENFLVQQKSDVKVLKDAETQNSMHEISRIDKNKVKLLLDEIWMCIENSSVQENPWKGSKCSPGKRANSQKKCEIHKSSLMNRSHSSPLKKDVPQSLSLHQLECEQEKNDQCELHECLIEGLKNNGDNAFSGERTVEVTRHQDPVDSPSDSSTDNGDDEEQDALSQQLQEILYWTQPLPPQLSPLPYLSSSGKQSVFGNFMDTSDEEGGNPPRRRVNESFSETDQPDSSVCTEAVTTGQSPLTEAGISESTLEKMNCAKTETENMNTPCLTGTETGDEASYPCLIAANVQCRHENNAEAQTLLKEIGRDSDMTTTLREQSVANLLPPNSSYGENLISPKHNYPEGMQGSDTLKDTVVSAATHLKTVDPELESSEPTHKSEDRIDTNVKEEDMQDLVSQEASSSGQLGTTSEEMEVEEIHHDISTYYSRNNECAVASVDSDRDHLSVDVAKEQTDINMVEEEIPLSQLNSTVVNGVAQYQCSPIKGMDVEEINCNSHASDKQQVECTQISLHPINVELPQLESPQKVQNPEMMKTPPQAEDNCCVETGVSQGSFKTLTSTDLAMENNNSIDSISHNEESKLPLNSTLASNIKETFIEFGEIKQSKLEKMPDIAPPGDLECSIEKDLSQFKSKKYVSIEDKGTEKINSVSLISDHQKDISVIASALFNTTEDFVVKEQSELDRVEGATILVTSESSIIADGMEGGSKDSACAGDVSDSIYSNNGLVESSNQKFIQENQSDLTIKEKDGLNRAEEMAFLEFDGFDTSKHDVPIAGMEIDSNDSRSDSPKDECISTSMSFSSQLSEVKSATMSEDFLCKAEKRSPLVKPDSSMSQNVILDQKKDCSSTEEMGKVVSKISTPQFTLISIHSSTEVSETSSVIKEEDIITKAEETSSFLVTDSSKITKLVQDNSTEYNLTEKYEDAHCIQSKSAEVTECENPVDKSKDYQLMENNKRERSEMEGIHNNTVKPSGDYLSSDQTSSHFDAFSDEFLRSNMSQNLEEQHFTPIGQNNTDAASNNTSLIPEEYSYTEKNKDEPLEKPLLGNGIQQPVPKSCSPTQICQVNEAPQTHEVAVSTLIGKIKKAKRGHRKSQGPIEEMQKTVHHKLDESDLATEVVTLLNLPSELEVQASKCKNEIAQHCPSDFDNVSTSNDTFGNNKSISPSVEESTIVFSDCIESKTEEFTLDKGNSQDPCQTPMLIVHGNTNKNDEASENSGNDMLVEFEASDLENPAQEVCDNETCSESSPNNDLFDCALKNKQLAGNNNNQDDMEKSESYNQNDNICTEEHFGIQMSCNRIGNTEQMSICKMSVKKVNSFTNILAGSSNYMPSVQKVDNSTQTELICNGSQVVLFTRSNWPTQRNITREDKDGIPKANCVSFFPVAASDHQEAIISVSAHEEEELQESIIHNSVKLKTFGTSVDDQSFKTTSDKKAFMSRLLPNASVDGDVQDGSSQKSKMQSTYKRRVALRRKSKTSNPNHMPVLVNTNASTPLLCMQEIHQVMLEMGQPLPPLLPPLVATPPRTIRSTKVQSPVTTSSMPSLCSPVDDLAFPSKETSKEASVSPLLDHLQQKSPPMQSPSPLDFARNERIQSSPLQFCTTTPKHAVPVPGRLPQSASASTGSTLPQENSVKILDAMYPNLSARARTLNILRGNVQLSMRGPADGEQQAGPVNQIMGFKAINSTPTAFVKTGSNTRSEGSAKDLEQQKIIDDSTFNAMDVSKQDQRAIKRCAEDDGGSIAKKLKLENVCQYEGNIADVITPKESPTVDDVDQTKPLCSRVMEPKTTNKTKLLSQPCEPDIEDAVASALMKITESCFDLLPVIRSHVFVGNIPQVPVLRDEEKEVICELSGNEDLMDALLLAIIQKLKVDQTTLDCNCLQALCRVYVAICRHQGDLERARLLSYSILKEDFPDSSKLLLFILSVWQNIFSMQGPINKAMQAVAKQRAKGDVMNCLSAYLNWEKNPPLDVSCLVSSFLVAMQQSPKVRFQASHERGMDFNSDMWELIYAIDLLCSQQQWAWTHDCFIRKEVWPVMDKWMKRRKGHRNVLHIQDVTVAGVMRLIGRLGQQGLKKSSATAVQNIATVINTFLQQAFQEGVPWPVQLSAAYAVYDLAPSNPKGALEALQKWNASVTEPIPTVAKNCLMELNTLCERLNFEK